MRVYFIVEREFNFVLRAVQQRVQTVQIFYDIRIFVGIDCGDYRIRTDYCERKPELLRLRGKFSLAAVERNGERNRTHIYAEVGVERG